MRNVVIEKSCTKCGGETSPRRFFKKSELTIPLDQQSAIAYCLFLLYIQVND